MRYKYFACVGKNSLLDAMLFFRYPFPISSINLTSKTKLTPSLFTEIPIPNQESYRLSMCVLWCRICPCLDDLSIISSNCPDSVAFFFFHFIMKCCNLFNFKMKSDVFSLFNHCAMYKHFIQHTTIQISNLVHTTRFCNNLHYVRS